MTSKISTFVLLLILLSLAAFYCEGCIGVGKETRDVPVGMKNIENDIDTTIIDITTRNDEDSPTLVNRMYCKHGLSLENRNAERKHKRQRTIDSPFVELLRNILLAYNSTFRVIYSHMSMNYFWKL